MSLNSFRMKLLIVFLAVVCIANTSFGQNQNAWLDTSFNHTGYKKFFTQDYADMPLAMRIAADNKILIANSSSTDFTQGLAITRINENGTIDESFATNGTYLFSYERPFESYSQTLIEDDLGRIIYCGDTYGNNDSAFVCRFLPNGTPDSTFSVDGFGFYNAQTGYPSVGDMTTDDNGNYFVLGSRSHSNAADSLDVYKILPDGSLDMSFGNMGIASIDLDVNTNVQSIEVLSDGRILCTVTYFNQNADPYIQSSFFVMFNADGTIDLTYGNNGVYDLQTYFDFAEDVSDSYVDDQGRVYVTIKHYVNTDTRPSIIRYNPDMTIDLTFGVNGFASDESLVGDCQYSSIDILGNKIVASGTMNPTSTMRALITEFDLDGQLIPSFGTNGSLWVQLPSQFPSDANYYTEFMSDGRIVGAGRSSSNSGMQMAGVFRLLTEPIIVQDVDVLDTEHFVLFPNPANNEISLRCNSCFNSVPLYTILNAVGQCVSSGRIGMNASLNISDLPNGVYVLKLQDGKQDAQLRFIKQD